MQSPFALQNHKWYSEMGDYIGMESCIDLQKNDEVVVDGGCVAEERWRCGERGRRWAGRGEKKEYPPPIQSAWLLKRYYTSDGRLIIREEKMRHHEYFRARRSNGRLTLKLIPFDDDDADVVLPLSPVIDEEERENNNVDDEKEQCEDDGVVGGSDEMRKDRTVEELVTVVKGGGGGGGKCYNYSSVRTNHCLFGMPVPAIMPVRI